jgi:quercetin dioxygenase-like cupin family protein
MADAARAMIVRPESVTQRIPAELSAARWTGGADVHQVHAALGSEELLLNVVYLAAGARSRPHSHSYEQVLLYLSGTGVVAVDGGEDQRVETMEFVLLPAGVAHMHGATDEGPASHLSIMREVDMDFDCPIPANWMRWRVPG